jgi:hypothetical protein
VIPLPDPNPDPGLLLQDRLPMPALPFGSSPDFLYLVQLIARGVDADHPAQIRLIAIDPDQGAATYHTLATGEICGNPWYLWQLCPPGPGPPLQDHRNIQNVVGRDGKLYFARIDYRSDGYPPGVVADRTVSRWYVVDPHGWPGGTDVLPTIEDRGIVDGGRIFVDDDRNNDRPVHCIYPLVMPTETGDIALFFSRYSAYGYMDLCWTAHRAFDPPGWTPGPISVMTAGEAGVSTPERWGDYEGIALDPSDGSRPWATGETGRCLTDCSNCDGGGQESPYFYTQVGSYQVPQSAVRTLSISCATPQPAPPSIQIKVMPADALGLADALVTAVTATARRYGQGSVVTLRAPATAGPYVFSRWSVRTGLDGDGPEDSFGPRQIVITMNTSYTATAVYVNPSDNSDDTGP